MKIALIRNTKVDDYGGAESYQISLAKELKKYGHNVSIICTSKKMLSIAESEGIDAVKGVFNARQNWSGIWNFLFPVYLVFQVKLYRWYKRYFKENGIEIVNIQSRDDWIAATYAAKKLGIKVLWTDHMDFRSWVLQNIDNPIKNFIGKMLMKTAKKADKIIFISDFEHGYFKGLKATRRLKNTCVIKNGAFDKKAEYEAVKTNDDSFAYVGRIVDYKGIEELIKAFSELSSKHNECVLEIYGDGPDFARYKKMAKANKNIEFCGHTNDPLKAVKESRFFVLPSYREGLSLSLLDACMMGRCMIASDVDGNPEIVKDKKTGYLAKPKDVESLAEAMVAAYEHKVKSDKMMLAARKQFEKEFDFEKIVKEKILPLYEK